VPYPAISRDALRRLASYSQRYPFPSAFVRALEIAQASPMATQFESIESEIRQSYGLGRIAYAPDRHPLDLAVESVMAMQGHTLAADALMGFVYAQLLPGLTDDERRVLVQPIERVSDPALEAGFREAIEDQRQG
jgi:hypothetical protein